MTPAHAGPPRGGFARAIPLSLAITFALYASVAHAANASVTMRDVAFQPASVTINVGETVTWTNQDGIPHSAKADNGSFDTGVFSTGSRTITFAGAGTFGYFCAVHPTVMRGTVRVLGAATPPPTPPPATTPPPTAPPPPPPTQVVTPRATVAVTTPPAPSPTPTATETATPSPTPSPTPSATAPSATPAPVAVQATVSPSPTAAAGATGASRSDEGPGPILIGAAVVTLAALLGVGVYLSRRA